VQRTTRDTGLVFGRAESRRGFTSHLVGALGAVLAGLAWIGSGLLTLLLVGQSPGASGLPSFYMAEIVFDGVGLAGMLCGLVGLYAQLETSWGRLGTWGFSWVLVGATLTLAACMAPVVEATRVGDLGGALSLGGVSGMFVGFAFLGVDALRTRALPIWCALALIVALPLSVVLADHGGEVILGLSWLALGYVLRSERRSGLARWSEEGAHREPEQEWQQAKGDADKLREELEAQRS
jgi:hypothetical protein